MLRRGVSLMEVMFAVGVISIGLLGVTAILPVALHQIGQGTVADRSTRTGINALSQFESLGMDDPQRWLEANGAAFAALPTSTEAFAIDPVFVSRHRFQQQAALALDTSRFPYDVSTQAAEMRRLTLRSTPLGTDGALYNARVPGALADSYFVDKDELTFDFPDDKSVPAYQQFSAERKSEGTMSWMATLIPDTGNTFEDALYTLSVIVLHHRDPRFYDDVNNDGVLNAGDAPLNNERVVDVTFYGSGLGGGDVTLTATTALKLDVKRGDWVMLMLNVPQAWTYNTMTNKRDWIAASPLAPAYGWFRIMDAESEPRSVGSNWEIDATLQGRDWDDGTAWAPPLTTRAAIIQDVVAVYERAIRLKDVGL